MWEEIKSDKMLCLSAQPTSTYEYSTVQQLMQNVDPQHFGQILLKFQNHRESILYISVQDVTTIACHWFLL